MASILIADDERLLRDMFSELLQLLEHDTITCTCAEEAWDLMDSGKEIDLVLTDLMMPGIGGRGLVTRMLGDERFCNLPVIIVSGKIKMDVIADLLEHPHIRKFLKPVSIETLVECINELLNVKVPAQHL